MNIDPSEIPADARVDKSARARAIARKIEEHITAEINATREMPKPDTRIGEESLSARIMADAKDTTPGTLGHLRLCFQAAVADRAWVNEHIKGMTPNEARARAEDDTRASFARMADFG